MHRRVNAMWESPMILYSHCWSYGPVGRQLIAVASFEQSTNNKIWIFNAGDTMADEIASIDCGLPITACHFIPIQGQQDTLATSSDYLRLYKIKDSGPVLIDQLAPSSNPSRCGPITSMVWTKKDPDQILTSSSDTTVTVWSVTSKRPKCRLIAHDAPVNDITESPKATVFATCSTDGSIRVFDQRDLEKSVILYDPPHKDPLIKLDWNMISEEYIVSVSENDSPIIIDVRHPGEELAKLNINRIEDAKYSPLFGDHLLTCGPNQESHIWRQGRKSTWFQKPKWEIDLEERPLTCRWNPNEEMVVSFTTERSLKYFSM